MMDFVPNELVYVTMQQREREARAASKPRSARRLFWPSLKQRIVCGVRGLFGELARGRRGCKLGTASHS